MASALSGKRQRQHVRVATHYRQAVATDEYRNSTDMAVAEVDSERKSDESWPVEPGCAHAETRELRDSIAQIGTRQGQGVGSSVSRWRLRTSIAADRLAIGARAAASVAGVKAAEATIASSRHRQRSMVK